MLRCCCSCSHAVRTTNPQGDPIIKLMLPVDIKQNPGKLKQSRGNQTMARNPTIPVYPNTQVPLLCFHQWLDRDDDYRARVEANFRSSKNNKGDEFVPCQRLFLQPAWYRKGTAAAAATTEAPNGTCYKDELQNAPAGQGKFEDMLKDVCRAAGVDPRTNHLLRHEFTGGCYDAGMSEAEIALFTRHTSVEGLRNYARCVVCVLQFVFKYVRHYFVLSINMPFEQQQFTAISNYQLVCFPSQQ